ncbi:hypothetical protein AGMMS49965_22020 [Bacteroidia bacterium]|nr:hypothetical protein AGMMS49965_22020 [Bacteroidia bacterium]
MQIVKKTVILCLLIVPLTISAQTQSGDLSLKNGTWSYDYYEGNQKISFEVLMDRLNSRDKQIANMFKSGKNMNITGTVISCIGAGCLGWDVGTRLAGAKGNTGLLVGGGGVLIGGLILEYVGERKMKKALTLYKDGSVSININTTNAGLGISLNF